MTREMTVKHTTGPWAWQRDGGAFFLSPNILITNFANGTLWGDEIDQANARLIAAAPDLLEALKEIEDTVDLTTVSLHLYDRVISAIAKAEGRS